MAAVKEKFNGLLDLLFSDGPQVGKTGLEVLADHAVLEKDTHDLRICRKIIQTSDTS